MHHYIFSKNTIRLVFLFIFLFHYLTTVSSILQNDGFHFLFFLWLLILVFKLVDLRFEWNRPQSLLDFEKSVAHTFFLADLLAKKE